MKQMQNGAVLIVAVVLIVIVAALVIASSFLLSSDTQSGAAHTTSAQALFIAKSGLQRAIYKFKSGTACASVNDTNLAVGAGSFSTTGTLYPAGPTSATLNGALTASATTIPVTVGGGGAFANFAPHGRIRIENEEINYSGTSTSATVCGTVPCFTGASRGAAGTIAAAHASAVAITQLNQCLIRSTGTVGVTGSVGSAQRILESAVLTPPVRSAFFPGGSSFLISSLSATSLTGGGFATSLPAGDNLLIAVVTFSDTGTSATINPGALQLTKSGTTLASNQFIVDVGGSASASAANFPQKTLFLVFKDVGAVASPTYDITAQASVNLTASGEAKMLIINGIPTGNSFFQDGGSVNINNSATTIYATPATTLAAGDNIILAAVQLDNTAPVVRSVAAGALQLRNGSGTIIASNSFQIDLAKTSLVNRGTGILLMARDVGAAANAQYSVVGTASANNAIVGEVKFLTFNITPSGLNSAQVTPSANTATTVVTLNSALPAGENVVIAATQYQNTNTNGNTGQSNTAAGKEAIVFNTTARSSNQFNYNLCAASGGGRADPECSDFMSGLTWQQSTADSNPAFSVQTQIDQGNVNVATQLMAIHLPSTPVDSQELF